MSRPAEKLDPEVGAHARLLAYYEQKVRELEGLIRQIETELSAVTDTAKRLAGQRRIKRLAGFVAENREKAERLAGFV